MNLHEELDHAAILLLDARVALNDEHEGNLRRVLAELKDTVDGMHRLVNSW